MNGASELFSALFGALVGGALAVIAQVIATVSDRKQNKKDKFSRDKGDIVALFSKILEMHAAIDRINNAIKRSRDEAKEKGIEGNLQQVRPIGDKPIFSTFGI